MEVSRFLAGIAPGRGRRPGKQPGSAQAGEQAPGGAHAPPVGQQPGEAAERQASPLLVGIVAAIAGAIAGAAFPIGYDAIYHYFHDPPGIETVTSLMSEEAAAAMTHDIPVVGRLYAPGAVVADAGCQARGASRAWAGIGQIEARYRSLPRFSALRHVDAQVTWQPDNSGAVTAEVTARTVGAIQPSASQPGPQFIAGNELWTFALSHGRWVVTSFTYNLCLPGSQGG